MNFRRGDAETRSKAKRGSLGAHLSRTVLVALALLAACAGPVGADAEQAQLEFRAEVVRVELEGGFWGLVAEDRHKFDPGRLAPEFQQAGLWVAVRANRSERVSFRQWGTPVDIVRIERIPAP